MQLDTDGLPRCAFTPAGSSKIGETVFIGNFVLFVGILLAIFLLHVWLTSGVEAYWLTKVTPRTRTPLGEVPTSHWYYLLVLADEKVLRLRA